jgi:ADP-heptose:LPS heptosyltransferase
LAFHLHRFRPRVSQKISRFLSPAAPRAINKSGMAPGRSVKSFSERSRAAKKIIVVDFGFLGDSVHLVPALWEIKRHYPAAELHTLSATVGAELLGLAPCVDRAWAFPLTPKSPPWWRHWNILWALRRERFDAAFNFSGSDRSIFVTAFLGARWTLAWEAGRKHFWNRWLSAEWVERGSRDLPVFEQRRQVLAAAGFALEGARFDLHLPQEAQQWAETAVGDRPVHLSINASTPLKEWPLENWITLAKALLAQNSSLRLAATASARPREQERLQALAAAVNNPRLSCFAGLSMARLAALLQRCRLHIGADSGVLHMALAFGVPTLTVFRQYEGLREWMPQGKEHRYLIVDCRCIAEDRTDCLRAGEAACLASITPGQVCEQACQLLR